MIKKYKKTNKELKDALKNEIAPLVIGLRNEIKQTNTELKKIAEKQVPINELEIVIDGQKVKALKGKDGVTPVPDKDYLSKETTEKLIEEKTPKKGIQYFTEKEIKEFLKKVTPVKGKDYRDGVDAHTPVKGKDYFTKDEVNDFLKQVTPIKGIHFRDGVDGITKTVVEYVDLEPKDIRNKLESLKGGQRLSAKAIKGLDEMIKSLVGSGTSAPIPSISGGGTSGSAIANQIAYWVNGTTVGGFGDWDGTYISTTGLRGMLSTVSASLYSDFSGNARDGTLAGTTSRGTAMIGDGSFSAGSGGYLRLPSTVSFNGLSATTFAFWFKISSTSGNLIGATSDGVFKITWERGGGLIRFLGRGWLTNKIDPAGAISTNVWHHIAVTTTSTSHTMYIDGASVGTVTFGASTITQGTANITLASNAFGGMCQGLYDDFGLWTRTLSAGEISALYNGGVGTAINPTDTGLVALYTFDTTITGRTMILSGQFNTDNSTFSRLYSSALYGIVPTANLGTGTANSSVFLRGDGTWATPTSSYADSAGYADNAGYAYSADYATYSDNSSGDFNVGNDLYVSGKVYSTGGIDPPYVLYDRHTRAEVKVKVFNEVSENKRNGASLFFNSETKKLEVYIASEDKYYSIMGELLT